MATIEIHAGDFAKGSAKYSFSSISFPWEPGDGFFGKSVKPSEIESVDIASEESVKRLGGSIGWGAVGAVILGPVGLLAGLLAGGMGKDVTFVAKLKDGRKFLGTTDSKTFTSLKSLVF